MKKIIIFVIVFAIIIGSSVGLVIANTKVQNIEAPTVKVIAITGKVQFKKANSNEWASLKTGDQINQSDIIKTEINSTVVINFYDNSMSKIGSESEVQVNNLFIDKDNFAKTNVGLFVTIGRVWSRIIQLADKESSFTVESNTTVATVRGTVFDFEVTKDKLVNINVIENIVEVATQIEKEKLDTIKGEKVKVKEIVKTINVSEGNSAIVNEKEPGELRNEIKESPLSEEVKQSNWFKENMESDKEFEKNIKTKQEELNKQIAGILPDSRAYGFKKMAEQIKLAATINEEKKTELESAFTSRRLAEAKELATNGKTILADRTMEDFENEVSDNFSKPERNRKEAKGGKTIRSKQRIKNQINLEKNLLSDVLPSENSYAIKEKLENIELDNIAEDPEKDFLRFKQTRERFKEIKALDRKGEKEKAKNYLDKIKNNIEALGNKFDPVLRERLIEERKLLENIKAEINPSSQSNPISSSTETVASPTSTPLNIEPMKNIPLPLPPKLYLPGNNLSPVKPPLNNTVPAPTMPEDNSSSIKLLEQTTAPILEPKKIIRLEVTADKYNMIAGETKQFKAIVYYNDNTERDVTGSVIWRTTGDIGSIGPGGLLKTSQAGGKGMIVASYTENNITLAVSSPEVSALSLIL